MYKWVILEDWDHVKKGKFVTDVPIDMHLLVVRVEGLYNNDTISLVADRQHWLFIMPGDFNNGYFFCDVDVMAHFAQVTVEADIARNRKKLRVSVFGNKRG